MSKEAKMADFVTRKARFLAAGQTKSKEKQPDSGKMTARERLAWLLDAGSFVELDQFVMQRNMSFGLAEEFPGEGVVTGYGTIDGRLVYVYAQNYMVAGGSLGEMHAAKISKVIDMAVAVGAPVIGIDDSDGARISEGIDALHGYGNIFRRHAIASGVVPQISVIMGNCAGSAAFLPGLTDFVFMIKDSQMFVVGPQVIKAVTGDDLSATDLGGALVQNSISGNAHFFAADEKQCLAQVRALVGFLPGNNLAMPPLVASNDSLERADELLKEIIPEDENLPYDVKEIIAALADDKNFLEVQPLFAANIVVGFIRINGISVGVVANQPLVLAGSLDSKAALKAGRFVRFCDAFNIPLLSIVDTAGFVPGMAEEQGGFGRHGAKLLYAFAEATVPKLVLITNKAYGGAYLAMCGKSLGADTVLAWPTAKIAVMRPQAAANILFRDEINGSADPVAKKQEKIVEYEECFATPYVAAGRGYVDMIVEPAKSRYYLVRALEGLLGKKEARPGKKHGNIPL